MGTAGFRAHEIDQAGVTAPAAREITLQSPWWKIESALTNEAKQQWIYRLASKKHHQDLITGLDWHTYHQVKKTLKPQHKHHLDTWVQAAVPRRSPA